MIETYLENAAKYLAQVEEGLANNNARMIIDATHPFKGLVRLKRDFE